jgi:hypothetical protein
MPVKMTDTPFKIVIDGKTLISRYDPGVYISFKDKRSAMLAANDDAFDGWVEYSMSGDVSWGAGAKEARKDARNCGVPEEIVKTIMRVDANE